MNKFQSILRRISAEACLKVDYFGNKSQKSSSAGCSAPRPPCLRRLGASLPDPRLDSMTGECIRPYAPIKHFWLIQMLGNFGAKWNLYFLPFLSCPKQKMFSRHWIISSISLHIT